MSQLLSRIKESNFRFVIPTLGKCFKSKIGKNDKVLLLVLNKGYIETDDIETCHYITVFLTTNKKDFFVPVGNLDKIKSDSGKILYRQRVYFKSLTTLLKVMNELNANIIIPSSFYVNTNNLINVIDDLPYLEKYAKRFKTDVDTWLTNVCKISVYEACKKLGMCDKINLTDEIYKVPMGYLSRAPLLCGSYSVIKHTSSVIKVDSDYSCELYNDCNSKNILPYGYTDSNVRYDIKRGVL